MQRQISDRIYGFVTRPEVYASFVSRYFRRMLTSDYQGSLMHLGWMEGEILNALAQLLNIRIRVFERRHASPGQPLTALNYLTLQHRRDYTPEGGYDSNIRTMSILHSANHYDRLVLEQGLSSRFFSQIDDVERQLAVDCRLNNRFLKRRREAQLNPLNFSAIGSPVSTAAILSVMLQAYSMQRSP